MKKAYITLCNSEKFVRGTLSLYESLVKTGTRSPLVVLMSNKTPSRVKDILKSYAINSKNSCKLELLETERGVICNGGSESNDFNKMMWARWSGTFDKLLVFGLAQYDKVVFVDSDMMILGNLDELFDRPHMSACCDGLYDKQNLNSGLMIIEPTGDSEFMRKMLEIVGKISQDKEARGDQDVIRAMYPNWSTDDRLHLPLLYNTFIDEAARNYSKLGYDLGDGDNGIRVVHFIGFDKPWYTGKELKWKIYNFVARRKVCSDARKKYKTNITAKLFKEYDGFLRIVAKKLKEMKIKIYEFNL